jgi:hypothetical protein
MILLPYGQRGLIAGLTPISDGFNWQESRIDRRDRKSTCTTRLRDGRSFRQGEAQGVVASTLLTREDPEERTAAREAEEWLRDFLGDDARPANEVFGEGKKAGIAPRTLQRAKSKLKIRSRKDGRGGWQWTLSEDRQPRGEEGLYQEIGGLGALPANASKSSVSEGRHLEERQPSDIGSLPISGGAITLTDDRQSGVGMMSAWPTAVTLPPSTTGPAAKSLLASPSCMGRRTGSHSWTGPMTLRCWRQSRPCGSSRML